jgi:hypothetical protein
MTTSRVVNKQCNRLNGVISNLASYNWRPIYDQTLYNIYCGEIKKGVMDRMEKSYMNTKFWKESSWKTDI